MKRTEARNQGINAELLLPRKSFEFVNNLKNKIKTRNAATRCNNRDDLLHLTSL